MGKGSWLFRQVRGVVALLWNNVEKKDIEDIHQRELATGKRVRLEGVENDSRASEQAAGVECSDTTEIRHAREAESLVEERYFMLDHLNGAAYEESKQGGYEGKRAVLRTETRRRISGA